MTRGWEKKAIGDVLALEYGKPLPKEQRCTEGGFPAYGANGIKCYSKESYWNHPSIIVGRKGTAGAVKLVDGEFWPLDVTYYVTFDSSQYDIKFLYYMLSNLDLPSLATGVKPGINRNLVYAIEERFPTLPEQERIVAILDEAFAGIDTAIANTKKNLSNARELFESYLNTTFSQRQERWVKLHLEDVLKTQPRNGWSPPAANHSNSGTPVLTLSSVTGFRFRPNKIKFTSVDTDSSRHYWVKDGDLLITRSNTPDLVGHVAIASNIMLPTIYPDLIMRMNTSPEQVVTEFVYYQLRSPALRKEITGRAQGANPTMKKIGKKAVQSLPISVPPLKLQKEIVTQLEFLENEVGRLEFIYQENLSNLTELKQSLLQKAFSGELTAEATDKTIDEAVA